MSNGRVYLDFETKSFADLKQVGSWAYSEHPSTRIICLCWRMRHANGVSLPVGEWVPGQDEPAELLWAIRHGYEVEAHKYDFELGIWENICVKLLGWPAVKPEQWRCTMATACYYALPAALDALCRALHWPGKDPEGTRLISKYSKLNLPSAKPEIPPEDLRKFIDYCKRDVILEEAVSDYLGDLPDRELPNFLLDQTINRRGLHLDQAGIAAATAIVDQRSADLTDRFNTLTGLNPTQGAKLLVWFADQGLKLANMQADYLTDLLEEGEIPAGPAREALQIRVAINKASTKKLDAMARNTALDGTAKFQSRYHGAVTGRDTGSGFQALNLVKSWEDVPPDQLVRDVLYGSAAWLDAIYGDAMAAVSKASRHWIRAKEGHCIMAGDFMSIEAVVLACLAGEDWKVQAFREGKKIYELMADTIYGLPEGTVTKKTHPGERADGKIGELAFGYQGALGAWLKFAGVKQDAECFTEAAKRAMHTDERIVEICKAWRKKHPAVVQFWYGLQDAAIEAVEQPGRVTGCRDIGFEIVDEWLSMILPNGKRLWYREPRLKMKMPRWHQPETKEACASGDCKCEPAPVLHYMAQKSGQWVEVSTYGGKLCENAVQGTSREYLMPSVKAAENAGYPVVLKVYDEVVADVPNGFGSLPEFLDLLKNAPGRDWAAGWPIGVDGWEGARYKK